MENSYFEMFNQKIRPFIQPAMFGYLAYFYTEVSMVAVDTQPADAELSNQILGAMNQYGMILSMLAALLTLSTFVASWFDDECEDNKKKTDGFSQQLQRAVNPLVMASIFQLLAVYVVGHSLGLPRYSNAESAEHGAESVAAGVITILSCLTAYMTVDPAEGDQSIREDGSQSWLTVFLDNLVGETRTHDMLACLLSGILVLIAWSYNVSRGAFVGPWYEAFTIMLVCVLANLGFGVKGANISNTVKKGINLILHVFIIYFLAKYLGDNADNFVALGLVIASAVLSVSSNKEPEDKRLNAQLNRIADLIVRITHGAVGVVAWMAVNEMPGTDDQLLHALIRIGVLLKLVACFLPVCQLEFLSRNGSTLLLLIPLAALHTDSAVDLQTAAFVLAVVARAVDAVQNMIYPKNDFSLDNIVSTTADELTAVPPRGTFDNPVIYVVLIGLITSSVGLVLGGNKACADGILNPTAACAGTADATTDVLTDHEATCVRVAIALVWTHAITALFGALVAMSTSVDGAIPPSQVGMYKTLGAFSPSTLEFFRTAVATTVLGLVSYTAHQNAANAHPGSELATWLYVTLFAYIFVDTLGRNVV